MIYKYMDGFTVVYYAVYYKMIYNDWTIQLVN